MDLFAEINKLNLVPGTYIVVGSGILAALGIRPSDDIDLVVSPEVFAGFEQAGWARDPSVSQPVLKHGPYDVGLEFGGRTLAELLAGAITINGVCFMSLAEVRSWKQRMGRDKDQRDVELIDAYLKSRTNEGEANAL